MQRGTLEFRVSRSAVSEGMPAAAEDVVWPADRLMEGAMVLSFWMVAFMLLPLVGLGTFAFLMNREREQHHHR